MCTELQLLTSFSVASPAEELPEPCVGNLLNLVWKWGYLRSSRSWATPLLCLVFG